jgi:hypothetical protein
VKEEDLLAWIKSVELGPADIAKGDQNTSEARRAAAVLFISYFSFNWAIELGKDLAALKYNLRFQQEFSRLTAEQAMYAAAFLCEVLCQELVTKYGTMEGVIKAAEDGTLFSAKEPDESFELLKDLDLESES